MARDEHGWNSELLRHELYVRRLERRVEQICETWKDQQLTDADALELVVGLGALAIVDELRKSRLGK